MKPTEIPQPWKWGHSVFTTEDGQPIKLPLKKQMDILRKFKKIHEMPPYKTEDYYKNNNKNGKRTWKTISNFISELKTDYFEYFDDMLKCPAFLFAISSLTRSLNRNFLDRDDMEKATDLFKKYFETHNFSSQLIPTVTYTPDHTIILQDKKTKNAINDSILAFYASIKLFILGSSNNFLLYDENKYNNIKDLILKIENKKPTGYFKLDVYSDIALKLSWCFKDNLEKYVDECKEIIFDPQYNQVINTVMLDNFIQNSCMLYNYYATRINENNRKQISAKLEKIINNYIKPAYDKISKFPDPDFNKDGAISYAKCYLNLNKMVTLQDLLETDYNKININNYSTNYIERYFNILKKIFKTKTPWGITQTEQTLIATMVEKLRETSPQISILSLVPQVKDEIEAKHDKELNKKKGVYATALVDLSKVIEKRLNIILTMYVDFLNSEAEEMHLYEDKEDFTKYKNSLASEKNIRNGVYQTQIGTFYNKISGEDKSIKKSNIDGKNLFMAFCSESTSKQVLSAYKFLADLAFYYPYRNAMHGFGAITKQEFEDVVNRSLFSSTNILDIIDYIFNKRIKGFLKSHPNIKFDDVLDDQTDNNYLTLTPKKK